jgi:hypothetical protein
MKVSKSKLVIFSVAVAFVSVFFFAYAVLVVFPSPEYDDFCGDKFRVPAPADEVDCIAEGGKWTDYEKDSLNMDIKGWCETDYTCEQEYRSAKSPAEKKIFFANLIVGIVLFVVAFFLGLEAVSSGLMGGAVMLIVYGSMRYWGELSDIWRTLMLGVALVVLIWLGYKKLKD